MHNLSLVFIDILLFGGEKMGNIKTNEIVGEQFEDLSIAEMAQVQGTGNIVTTFPIPTTVGNPSILACIPPTTIISWKA